MKRLTDALAPLGLLLIVGAMAWTRTGRVLPGKLDYWLLAGAALVVLSLVLRGRELADAIGRRQLRYGGNTFVMVLVVLGILGALNYLVVRNTKRFDLTKGQRYSLSDQTKKILAGLKEDVRITYFQRTVSMAAGQDRLKEYQTASSRIKVDFVDPLQSPAKSQAYDVKGPWPMLVVEKGTNRERISNDSEQDLTNALIKVTREAKKAVCFVEGEGERDIDDSGERGFSGAKAALARNQYEVKKVLLLREKAVPADCTVLVLSGPEKDLLPPVVDALRSYVKGGGKLLALVEPELKEPYPNIAALLKEWNLELQKDVVVDVSGIGQLFGTGEFTPIVAQYPYHEITKDSRVMTAFHTARSVTAGTGTLPGVSAQNLLETSQASWAESDLSLKGRIEMNEGKDRRGPISLGAVATLRDVTAATPSPAPAAEDKPSASDEDKPPPSGEGKKEPAKKEGRVVAIGDADFASNTLLSFQGNQDFFLNSVAWLAQDMDLISIRPKEPEDQRLFLTRNQQQNVAVVALLLLPGLFVVLGIFTWWKRR
jgi:ABC-type uncharacterized transport system involved in gliding motility auxiliary subunit